jgi:hypothetical protein
VRFIPCPTRGQALAHEVRLFPYQFDVKHGGSIKNKTLSGKAEACGHANPRPEKISGTLIIPLELNRQREEFPPVKLQQGQVWKCGDQYVRIVQLERLEVGYKSASNLKFSDGKHQHTSKKDFCRLLKGATLVSTAAENSSPPPARTA